MPPLTQKSLDFNPRSREGSDFWPADLFSVPPISIHAPARGATDVRPEYNFHLDISIHAPARGATESNEGLFYLLYNFNPRSREGSDGGPCQGFPRYHHISIHAPARGATVALQPLFEWFWISIHAPARGATDTQVRAYEDQQFQSTLPRGERRIMT